MRTKKPTSGIHPARRSLSQWIRVGVLGVVTTCCTASIAWAETEAVVSKEEKPWLQWMLLVVFVVLCTCIAFKNPKRSHMG